MHTAIRPYMTTGIAIVGASVIAIAPIKPITGSADISIPMPTLPSPTQMEYTLAAFPEDLLAALAPILAQQTPAQLVGVLDDLGALVGAAINPLFGGLALVVDTLLDGLTELVDTLLTDLVPVVDSVFAGLALVVVSLVPVVL